ncbi:MAG: hypothetical protein ACI9MC_003404 [Kiritimatiellia bacterium]|jgi:hypothetical protein
MIAVTFDEPDRSYRPGDTINGHVVWQGGPFTEGALRLLWTTTGRGTQDVGVQQLVSVHMSDNVGSTGFTFEAPAFPYSFSGTLLSIEWYVELSVRGDAVKQLIVIGPDGREVQV